MKIIKIISSSRERMAICQKNTGTVELNVFSPGSSDAEIAAAIMESSTQETPRRRNKVDSKKLKG